MNWRCSFGVACCRAAYLRVCRHRGANKAAGCGYERARGDRDVVAAGLFRVRDEVPAVGRLEGLNMGKRGVEPVDGGVIGGEVKTGRRRGEDVSFAFFCC